MQVSVYSIDPVASMQSPKVTLDRKLNFGPHNDYVWSLFHAPETVL